MGINYVDPEHTYSQGQVRIRISSENGTDIPEFDETVSITITSGLSDMRLYLTPVDTMNLIDQLNKALDDLARRREVR